MSRKVENGVSYESGFYVSYLFVFCFQESTEELFHIRVKSLRSRFTHAKHVLY